MAESSLLTQIYVNTIAGVLVSITIAMLGGIYYYIVKIANLETEVKTLKETLESHKRADHERTGKNGGD